MSLLNFYRALWNGKGDSGELSSVERDCTLQVFLCDSRCRLLVLDDGGGTTGELERLASDSPPETKSLLLLAIEALPPELEHRIKNVEVFLDDQEISVIDSRQAKLSHFEGRALAEFGQYQMGGKPVCFASHKFGETSAQEAEKRIVAYIPEDRLTIILFALGKLARFTTFLGPWSLQQLFADESDETQAQLTVHGHYSTLAFASDSAGCVAVRQLPFGTAHVASAYARAHGIEERDAAEALAARNRFSIGKQWPLLAQSPAASTGTGMALAPLLERLSSEIGTTADYFEFQRLAGRAVHLRLVLLGSRIAGFAGWLSNMLQIGVTADEPMSPAPRVLNLLEGMRSGLLKIGNQHFDFVDGHFVLAANQVAGTGTGQSMAAKWKSASSQPVSVTTLKPFLAPAMMVALVLVGAAAGYFYVLVPIDQDSQASANLYTATLSHLAESAPTTQVASEPVLWAKDLMTIGAVMPYDMKLKRIALVAGAPTAGTTLEITGILPKTGSDNLQLIGRFMGRLTASAALHRRLGEIDFGGVGEDDSKDSGDAAFKIVGKVLAGSRP